MRLEAEDLTWMAGNTIIVDGISVPAMPGRILGLLGPNGSGKSTLLGMLARTIQPRAGMVLLDGKPQAQWPPVEVARRMSVVQQKATTDQDVTVRDVIDLGRIPHRRRWSGPSPRDREMVAQAAQRTGIEHLLDRDWQTLSGGEQQRAHLARAFAQEGQVMLLDEPTNHLDISHQLEILAALRDSGVSVVVALHDLNLATTFCDEVLVIHQGQAVCLGKPAEVLTADLIREVYGVEVRILHPEGDEAPLFQFLRPASPTM
jgi:iron compound ABC transporter, ATP-binding protein